MQNQRQWFVIFIFCGLCITGGWVIFNAHPVFSPARKNSIDISLTESTSVPVSSPDSSALSKEAEYPTPVIQLQQTLTADLLKKPTPATERSSSQLEKKLAEFSQTKIQTTDNPPQALAELKQRLQRLQSITQPITPDQDQPTP